MKPLLLFLLFLALPILRAEEVLFIGNSFVYTNNMPRMLETIATSKGKIASTEAITKGGQGWTYHLYEITEKTDSTLKSKPWNFVVIQDYSTNATHVNSRRDFFKNGGALYDKITAEAPTAAVVLYETWSFPAAAVEGGVGASDDDKPAPKAFKTEAEMFDEIHTNYGLLFEQLKTKDAKRRVILAPVGTVFTACRKAHPEINLFGQDRKHPSVAGSYLIACVFYSLIYHDSPVGAGVAGDPSIDPAIAKTLQEVAAAAILKN